MSITREVAKIPGTIMTGEHGPFLNAYNLSFLVWYSLPPKHRFEILKRILLSGELLILISA